MTLVCIDLQFSTLHGFLLWRVSCNVKHCVIYIFVMVIIILHWTKRSLCHIYEQNKSYRTVKLKHGILHKLKTFELFDTMVFFTCVKWFFCIHVHKFLDLLCKTFNFITPKFVFIYFRAELEKQGKPVDVPEPMKT